MVGTGLMIFSIAWSSALLIWLARIDPKRRRTQQQSAASPGAIKYKKPVTWLLFLPAPLFLSLGDWPSLLMWLGSILCIGWAISLIYTQSS